MGDGSFKSFGYGRGGVFSVQGRGYEEVVAFSEGEKDPLHFIFEMVRFETRECKIVIKKINKLIIIITIFQNKEGMHLKYRGFYSAQGLQISQFLFSFCFFL